ncbi:hypothetical protein H243_3341 [Klebsiella pneumoniae UHKPC04]|nr:hypothetical protein H243_3341 [Klebsiella pneumoniae UHKPC04]EPP03550.1 hypothetical protein J048_3290 [Klebsiella pneumoniae 120_1020]
MYIRSIKTTVHPCKKNNSFTDFLFININLCSSDDCDAIISIKLYPQATLRF